MYKRQAQHRVAMQEVAPAGFPADLLGPAQRTLDAAVIASAKLPESVARPLLEAAHAAFGRAVDYAALACVVAMLLALLIARARLRRI